MRKLTPLGLGLVVLLCLVAAVSGFMAVAAANGENPLAVLRGNSETSVVEVYFPDDVITGRPMVGAATVRLATIVGSERAVGVVCPVGFEPDRTSKYVAESHRLETYDGRITPTVWVLRASEYTSPEPPTTGELVIVK